MGESLDFRELLSKKKTIGEWRLIEELTPVIDELVEPESLIKLMDTALVAVEEVLPEYRLNALVRISENVAYYFMNSILDMATEYVTFKTAWEKLIPYITMAAFFEIFDTYEEYLTAREENKALLRQRIEKYAKLLKEYAERYPDLTVKGLLLFANIIDNTVKVLGREIAEFGHPLT
jgi:hypothetical protein